IIVGSLRAAELLKVRNGWIDGWMRSYSLAISIALCLWSVCLCVVSRVCADYPYHITALMDVYCRAGQFEKAEALVAEWPLTFAVTDKFVALTTILGACRVRSDVKRGERTFERIQSLYKSLSEAPTKAAKKEWDEGYASANVLMANIYAASGM